jgi:hypothetical protein
MNVGIWERIGPHIAGVRPYPVVEATLSRDFAGYLAYRCNVEYECCFASLNRLETRIGDCDDIARSRQQDVL